MKELEVTQVWMAGVVSMMIVFGVFAIIGYALHKSRERQ